MVAVVALSGFAVLLSGGCRDDEATAAVSELTPFLLEDADVVTVLPDLEAKSDYSTGEDYGVAIDAELVGPTETAESAVVRQWSQGTSHADDGEAWTVISSVFSFASPAEAESAAAAVLDRVEADPVEVGNAFVVLTDPQDGRSSGVAVTTRDSRLATVQVEYVGAGDEHEVRRLAQAAARRLR